MPKHDEHHNCGGHDHAHDEGCACSHTHEHDESCGCGHSHEHDENCGCGHTHEHDESCGCGHTHAPVPTVDGLSSIQVDFLLALRQRQCLPIACFTFSKSDDNTRHGVALAPVYISAADDSMELVKKLGKELSLLEQMDLITLDYDIPLQNYPYEEYKNSALYAYFLQTVSEAARQPDATFDKAGIDLGSMALTDAGEEMVDQIIA